MKHRLASIECVALEAELILAHVLGVSREDIVFKQQEPLAQTQLALAEHLVDRRIEGKSLAHLLGMKEFWGLDMILMKDVLSPRPETETLIEALLEIFPKNKRFSFAELGTGSGCLITSLLYLYRNATGLGCDCYQPAFFNTKENLRQHKVIARSKMMFCRMQVFKRRGLDLIISNPPYINTGLIKGLSKEVKSESYLALNGGFDGLLFYREIIKLASLSLRKGGYLLIEIGAGQLNAVRKTAQRAGVRFLYFAKDLSGIERVCVLRKSRN